MSKLTYLLVLMTVVAIVAAHPRPQGVGVVDEENGIAVVDGDGSAVGGGDVIIVEQPDTGVSLRKEEA
ncbi:jg6692 [Pararge aegeria aegeria]|uniref:Jg6692 protein n=1 Tax=Pararge aegeria aegeria TaxID=348720 RepID=A0A8S4SIP8_9NEOP|nr:jg6692 [Pararge aegeria aegeria]